MSESRERLDAIYATLPTIDCKGLCHDSCGVVPMSRVESRRILEREGMEKAPPLVKDEEGAWTCPLLTADKRCRVYDIRPLICRLYGVVQGMQCPHGCAPSTLLPDSEGGRLLRLVMEIR